MQTFLIQTIEITLMQIGGIFGLFFLIGFLLSFFQQKTQTLYRLSVGWQGILWTAWIGTPIHEIGHMLMAILFRHRLRDVSLFRPNKDTGDLGHVGHTFNTKNPYHQIGNFFIGAAPLIFGAIILLLLARFLIPNGKELVTLLTTFTEAPINTLGETMWQIVRTLFAPSHLVSWKFWIFLYISFCIASHIAPSREDRKNMWQGLLWIVGFLFIINSIFVFFGKNGTPYILEVRRFLTFFFASFMYAFFISLVHFILARIALTPILFLRRR